MICRLPGSARWLVVWRRCWYLPYRPGGLQSYPRSYEHGYEHVINRIQLGYQRVIHPILTSLSTKSLDLVRHTTYDTNCSERGGPRQAFEDDYFCQNG